MCYCKSNSGRNFKEHYVDCVSLLFFAGLFAECSHFKTVGTTQVPTVVSEVEKVLLNS